MKRVAIKLLDHLFLFRVPLLAPVWTVFLLGMAYGGSNRQDIEVLMYLPELIAFSFLVGGIYILNQIFDIKSDRINEKLFILPRGLVSLPVAWCLSVLSVSVPVVFSYYRGLPLFLVFSASAIMGILYNCPPFEWKNSALLGLTSNMVGHGFLTFGAGWFAIRSVDNAFWIPAAAISLANGAVYLCTTIPDAEGDSGAGKRTFAVVFGKRATARVSVLLVAGSLALGLLANPIFKFPIRWIIAFTAVTSLPFFIVIWFSSNLSHVYRAFKIPVFILTCCVFIVAPWYAALVAVTFWGSRLYYKKRFNKNYPTFRDE